MSPVKPPFLALTKSGIFQEGVDSSDVSGPAGAVDGDLAAFDGVTGTLIKDSGVPMAAAAAAAQQALVGASTIALGTNSGNAAVLPAGTGGIYPTTAADDTVGVRIHINDKVLNRKLFIGNGVSNKILKIYPPTGGTINGASADAAFSTLSGQSATLVCTSASSNTWLAFC